MKGRFIARNLRSFQAEKLRTDVPLSVVTLLTSHKHHPARSCSSYHLATTHSAAPLLAQSKWRPSAAPRNSSRPAEDLHPLREMLSPQARASPRDGETRGRARSGMLSRGA